MKKIGRILLAALLVSLMASGAQAYIFQGGDVVVDYWAGSGANETLVVIDWNNTNGPYVSESHAFGYNWDGTATVQDALDAIDSTGALEVIGSGFINYLNYNDGTDNHSMQSPTDYNGWLWLGSTMDFGTTWTANGAGTTSTYLGDGSIQGINSDGTNWTSATLTIPEAAPVPVPAAVWLLGTGLIGLIGIRRRK